MRNTLLLNASFEPISVISWQQAVSLWFTDKVEIVEEYDDFDLKSVSITIKCPAVVRLLKYVNLRKQKVRFSRMNVFGRDGFTCQYCGVQPGTPNLTYDHVLPKSRGGKTCWANIVTSCVKCNSKKADRTPEEAGMSLKTVPSRPSSRPINTFVFHLPKTPDAWRSYLYWTQSLDED